MVNIFNDLKCPFLTVGEVEIGTDPCYKVVLEHPLDKLV